MSFPKIRDITLDLLHGCGIDSPPVPLEPVLEHFGAVVVNSRNIASSALFRVSGKWVIRVNSEYREERKIFRIAHEIGHIYWSRPEHNLGDPELGGNLERYCSKFASLLLAPHQWFSADAEASEYDLFEVRKLYSNVSHEVLALRLSSLTSMVVTIYDNGELYRRFSSPGLGYPPRRGQAIEREVYEQADLYGRFAEKKGSLEWGGSSRRVRVRGYPVIPGDNRRFQAYNPAHHPRDQSHRGGQRNRGRHALPVPGLLDRPLRHRCPPSPGG